MTSFRQQLNISDPVSTLFEIVPTSNTTVAALFSNTQSLDVIMDPDQDLASYRKQYNVNEL